MKLSIHFLIYWRWVFAKKSTPQDYYAEAMISVAARWEGEIAPILTYTGMFDKGKRKDNGAKIVE